MEPSSEKSVDKRAEESIPKPASVPPPRKSRKSKKAKSRDSDRWKGNPEEATPTGPTPPPLPKKKSPAPITEKPVAEPTPPPVECKSKPTPTKPTSKREQKSKRPSKPQVDPKETSKETPKVDSKAASTQKDEVDTDKQPKTDTKQKADANPTPKPKTKLKEQTATKASQKAAEEPVAPPQSDPTLEPVEAPPTAEELTDAKPTRGYQADEDKRVTVYGLALLMAVVAVITCIPSVWALVYNFQNELYQPRWIYLLLLLGSVQLAYAIFLAQVHDWSTAQVAMVFTALLTTFFAMGLGIATTSEADNEMLSYLGILFSGDRELDRLADGSMLSWCLIMTALNGLLTYFNSRVAFRWHKTYLIATTIPTEQTWEMEV